MGGHAQSTTITARAHGLTRSVTPFEVPLRTHAVPPLPEGGFVLVCENDEWDQGHPSDNAVVLSPDGAVECLDTSATTSVRFRQPHRA